ncbi:MULTISPECIES: hypothetical protein [unclassified Chryseobacterium]|uniref:hypothetical protein n=1 Tax=unclassified Chryseobacterium TaxID=2593645 RepID=UPI000E0AA802|nr:MULTISPECIES: hypothetical protein [unclassified Chryseobacterium]MDQ1857311.1 hypothetical protein [Chryseobacterium sp. WLY505]
MKAKKNQTEKILKAQNHLLNYKILEMQMINSSLLDVLGGDSRYVAGKNLELPDDNSEVTVSIYFGGENQFGSARLKVLRTNKPSIYIETSEDDIVIGTCKELIGNAFVIGAEITDSNRDPENNNTILKIKIKQNNKIIYQDSHTIDVGNEGATATFTYNITFY